jgi:hypothetical protein
MRTATTVIQMLIRVLGVVQIVLGLLFWSGNASNLVGLHMLTGILLVLGLWVLAGLGARAGVGLGLVALAVVWGLITPVLGMTQAQLLPGAAHWVIQVLHLLIGLGLLGRAETLAARIKARRPALRDAGGPLPVGGAK